MSTVIGFELAHHTMFVSFFHVTSVTFPTSNITGNTLISLERAAGNLNGVKVAHKHHDFKGPSKAAEEDVDGELQVSETASVMDGVCGVCTCEAC